MTDNDSRPDPKPKSATFTIEPGKPIRFESSSTDETAPDAGAPSAEALGKTLKAYRQAAKALVEGTYASAKEYAPPHLREPCSAFVVRCSDGILVRYDPAPDGHPKVRVVFAPQPLAEIAPPISEQVLHFPADPKAYTPPSGGVRFTFTKQNAQGATQELFSLSLMIFASAARPEGFTEPAPPARPLPLVLLPNEFELQMHGTIEPAEPTSAREVTHEEDFVTRSLITLPVGWRAIEVYPPLGDEHWKPEYAPIWAELDILSAIAQRNLHDKAFKDLDPRAESRKRATALLAEFATLLEGPEEPVHQFLKMHPELLNQTFLKCWSKLPFGDHVSDFVFREPPGEYELVEIEAPIRELFRKDGHQRQELTHAINQIDDWIRYIADNKGKVASELGLVGIGSSPRALVVIGRSQSLTDKNRKKLATIQERQQRLRILTYDDLLARARANFERLLGPLDPSGRNIEVYYFRPTSSG